MDKEYWERRDFIEFCFKNELKIKLAIVEKKLDPNKPKSAGHGSGISKPTEIQAINNVMPIKAVVVDNTTIPLPELWLRLIIIVKSHYNYMQSGTLYWLRYHKEKHRADILSVMNISKTRYHQLIIEIVDYAMKQAETMDLKYGVVGVVTER